jgi:hypothetical protein
MRSRGFSSVEIALGVAVIGSLLAVSVPAFVRNLHASHVIEAVDGLAKIQSGAVAYAHANGNALPPSAPLTPASVPRGTRAADLPGVWDHPSWRAVDFRAAPENVPHAYAFAIDSSSSELVARSHGDLDGDGIVSTFEVRVRQESDGMRAVAGMYVEAELE